MNLSVINLLILRLSSSERFDSDHYAAYILTDDGTIEGINLGPAEPIDTAIGTFAGSLASPDTPQFQVKEEAQILYSLVMTPVRQSLGNTTTVCSLSRRYSQPDSI